ncbi:MAG: hypothetical protein ABSC25_08295 [Roseiarcus sp.]|jgi:hypothetical protein
MKSVRQQIEAMRRYWPGFDVAEETADRAVWFGSLAGIELQYRLAIEFGLPVRGRDSDRQWRRFPVVRVLTPELTPNWDAKEEAPLPHVYFELPDITLSPLCLFDPRKREWRHDDLIATTTVPWAADWLACYEGWLATGRWTGGGRHADAIAKRDDS